MKKRTLKQNVALIGVILIVIMVLATLITAFADPTGRYFRSCLIVTIALPIALWVFMWAYGAMMHKHTPASFDLGGADNPSTEKGMADTPSTEEGMADIPSAEEAMTDTGADEQEQ